MTDPDWRVLQGDTMPGGTPNPAAWNMDRDERLLEEVLANAAPPTVRLYQWQCPAITIGRFQDAERTLHLDACEEEGIEVGRRITGGRGILHGDDLTIAVAASLSDVGLAGETSVVKIYSRFAAAFVCAFRTMGVAAAMGAPGQERGGDTGGDCFAAISRADVVQSPSGRKLLGAALYRRYDGILLQASIPLCQEPERFQEMAVRLFRGAGTASLNAPVIGLDADGLKCAIINGLSRSFEVCVC